MPQYTGNIVECGVKHHNPWHSSSVVFTFKSQTKIFPFWLIQIWVHFFNPCYIIDNALHILTDVICFFFFKLLVNNSHHWLKSCSIKVIGWSSDIKGAESGEFQNYDLKKKIHIYIYYFIAIYFEKGFNCRLFYSISVWVWIFMPDRKGPKSTNFQNLNVIIHPIFMQFYFILFFIIFFFLNKILIYMSYLWINKKIEFFFILKFLS